VAPQSETKSALLYIVRALEVNRERVKGLAAAAPSTPVRTMHRATQSASKSKVKASRKRFLLEAADESDGEGGVACGGDSEDGEDEWTTEDLLFIDDDAAQDAPVETTVITEEEKLLDDDDYDLIFESTGLMLAKPGAKSRKRLRPCDDSDEERRDEFEKKRKSQKDKHRERHQQSDSEGSLADFVVEDAGERKARLPVQQRRTQKPGVDRNYFAMKMKRSRNCGSRGLERKAVAEREKQRKEADKAKEEAQRSRLQAAMDRMFPPSRRPKY